MVQTYGISRSFKSPANNVQYYGWVFNRVALSLPYSERLVGPIGTLNIIRHMRKMFKEIAASSAKMRTKIPLLSRVLNTEGCELPIFSSEESEAGISPYLAWPIMI